MSLLFGGKPLSHLQENQYATSMFMSSGPSCRLKLATLPFIKELVAHPVAASQPPPPPWFFNRFGCEWPKMVTVPSVSCLFPLGLTRGVCPGENCVHPSSIPAPALWAISLECSSLD